MILLTVPAVNKSANGKNIYFKKDKNGTYIFTDSPFREKKWLVWNKNARMRYTKNTILKMICDVASRLDMDPVLLRSVVEVESYYDPYVTSPMGAIGLMQLMPGTAEKLGLDDPFDPYKNLYFGAKYLKYLIKYYGKINIALAAYHAGEGNIRKYEGMPEIDSTKAYVKKILKTYEQYKIMYKKNRRRFCGG